jgi:glycosyltransferase involved in cell wall biosynthesis
MTLISSQRQRPPVRATVLFLAYNQAAFVEHAAHSVLEQDCEPAEIILSDDASTDGTFEILQRLADAYDGPHFVRARRNERNLGIGDHYNRLVEEAAGDLLVTAAGDDVSVPYRVARLLAAWDAHGQGPDLVASHLVDMTYEGELRGTIEVDDLGRWPDAAAWAVKRPYIVGAGHAFTKRLWNLFGPMSSEIVYEDQVITLRAILAGGGITVAEPLVYYRRGGASALHTFESTAAFLQRTRLVNQRARAEQRQLLADARKAGHEELVNSGLQQHIQREALIAALLDSRRPADTLRALAAASAVRWPWRLRKWLYLRCPGLGTTVRRLQYGLRQLRRGR